MEKRIILLPGDGIGKEILEAAVKVLHVVEEKFNHRFVYETHAIGGNAIDRFGVPLTDETVNACKNADAVLLGAVGGPKWDNVPADIRPEKG
ncbi:MAG: isocitrate/isopropylmalate family dehydrogenase, partial [Caldibacillus thermoamylovorans]